MTMLFILGIIILFIITFISMVKETGTTPKHVFMYLLLIAMLYVSVISFIAIIFQYINVLLPDPLNQYLPGIYDAIRFSSSALIVAFPVYLLMSWLMEKEYKAVPETKNLKTRKWLAYLTLFIAAITIIIDLVQLVHNFYGGELTTSFVLKVVTVLLVAASVFAYHLWDLQKGISYKMKKGIASIVSAIILISLIAGFFIAGSPAHQRDVRFDQQRLSDLQGIQYQVTDFWQRKNKLPTNLTELEDSLNGYRPPTDPATGKPYTYEVKSDLSFTLCADFAAEQEGKDAMYRESYAPYPIGNSGENWNHGVGNTCFDRTIDPERHGIPNKGV